jgi:hypothetical protein
MNMRKTLTGIVIMTLLVSSLPAVAEGQNAAPAPAKTQNVPASADSLQAACPDCLPMTPGPSIRNKVAVQAGMMPDALVRRIFGKAIAESYGVFLLTISNRSDTEAFILQNVFVDYSRWSLAGCKKTDLLGQTPLEPFQEGTQPCQFASAEQGTVRALLQNGQNWSWRSQLIRYLTTAGAIVSGFTWTAGARTNFPKIVGTITGTAIPSLSVAIPDEFVDRLNLLSDEGFRANTAIPKGRSAIVIAFFPLDRFLTPGLKRLFQKVPALFFSPDLMMTVGESTGHLGVSVRAEIDQTLQQVLSKRQYCAMENAVALKDESAGSDFKCESDTARTWKLLRVDCSRVALDAAKHWPCVDEAPPSWMAGSPANEAQQSAAAASAASQAAQQSAKDAQAALTQAQEAAKNAGAALQNLKDQADEIQPEADQALKNAAAASARILQGATAALAVGEQARAAEAFEAAARSNLTAIEALETAVKAAEKITGAPAPAEVSAAIGVALQRCQLAANDAASAAKAAMDSAGRAASGSGAIAQDASGAADAAATAKAWAAEAQVQRNAAAEAAARAVQAAQDVQNARPADSDGNPHLSTFEAQHLQDVLNRLSLNAVRIVANGIMTVNVDSVPAAITKVEFDGSGPDYFALPGTKTGKITGQFLSNANVNLSATDTAKFTDLKPVTAGSGDNLLNFSINLTRGIAPGTVLHFSVTKSPAGGTPLVSNEFAYTVNYTLPGAPTVSKVTPTDGTGPITLEGTNLYDANLKITLVSNSLSSQRIYPDPNDKTAAALAPTGQTTATTFQFKLNQDGIPPGNWFAHVVISNPASTEAVAPAPILVMPPAPTLGTAVFNSDAKQIAVTGTNFYDFSKSDYKPGDKTLDLNAALRLTFNVLPKAGGAAIPVVTPPDPIVNLTTAALTLASAAADGDSLRVYVGQLTNTPVTATITKSAPQQAPAPAAQQAPAPVTPGVAAPPKSKKKAEAKK